MELIHLQVVQVLHSTKEQIQWYEFAVNDALSVSYSREDHAAKDKGTIAMVLLVKHTKTTMEAEVSN